MGAKLELGVGTFVEEWMIRCRFLMLRGGRTTSRWRKRKGRRRHGEGAREGKKMLGREGDGRKDGEEEKELGGVMEKRQERKKNGRKESRKERRK